MTIYEIEQSIINLVDEETGEITDYEAFEQLQMSRDAKIENLCLWYKDLIAEAKAVKEEKQNLADRQKALENKAENLKMFIKNILQGEKFKTSKCVVGYRKSEKTVIDEQFVEWAKDKAPDLLKFTEPVANLTAIKNAIKAGEDIQYAGLEESQNISIK